jgi:hypothetical protein
MPSVQIISFYETSSNPYNINLEELEREIKYLTEALDDPSKKATMIFILGFKQKQSSSSSSSSNSNAGSSSVDKAFRIQVPLTKSQVNNLLNIFATIRNVGSDNADRSLASLSAMKLTFDTAILIKLPNNGEPTLVNANSIYVKPTTLMLNFIENQYLLKTRELRWVLQANTGLSGNWGEKNSFSFIVAVDDAGSAVFSSFTQKLNILTMYSTFIYVIGQAIAKVFKVPAESIWVSNIPNAAPVIKLCEAIALARAEEDLDKEVKMYYSLIDIMRSPELVKRIGEDYLKFIEDTREDLIKQSIWVVRRNLQLEEKKKFEELKRKSKQKDDD